MSSKTRVAVLYGGQSGEHEVSLQSAASVIRHLDRQRFEIVPVGIDKRGVWRAVDLGVLDATTERALPIAPDAPAVRLAAQGDGLGCLVPIAGPEAAEIRDIGVVFPVMHGPLYEDGALQGLLELAGTAYVGSGIVGSAVGMDKDVAKRLAASAGIPIAPYVTLRRDAYEGDPARWLATARDTLALPVFVKPCNMGSSVGVSKVKTWEALEPALGEAFLYDTKVLVEQGIDAREIEVAVLETDPLLVSVASELNAGPAHEFYSYDAKYIDSDGATVDLPAKLAPGEADRVRALAAEAFVTLECSGLARVDFFLDRQTGGFFFNEINTLPGFTSISMYPKMMEASGISYPVLLTRLVDLALQKHVRKHALKRDSQG